MNSIVIKAKQLCHPFASICLLYRKAHTVRSSFVCNTLLNNTEFRVPSTYVHKHKPLQFSTSTLLKAESKVMAEGDRKELSVHYNDIKEAQTDDKVLIIDVREQAEIDETGKLPGSIHIPMGEVSKLLTSLSEENFKEKFDKAKPSKSTKIILSCRSGMRSAKVQEEIQKLGYENAYNYVGGWLDWESNQKV